MLGLGAADLNSSGKMNSMEGVQSNNNGEMPTVQGARMSEEYALATLAIHADDAVNVLTDVAPPMHVSTTFRYDNSTLDPVGDEEVSFTSPKALIYTDLNLARSDRKLPRLLSPRRAEHNTLRSYTILSP